MIRISKLVNFWDYDTYTNCKVFNDKYNNLGFSLNKDKILIKSCKNEMKEKTKIVNDIIDNNKDIIDARNRVYDNWIKLSKKLGINNTIGFLIFIKTLFEDGFFSIDRVNAYDEKRKHVRGLYSSNVFNGKSVCLEDSYFLKEILSRNNIYSAVLFCSDNEKEDINTLNHCITLIKEDDMFFGFDLVNDDIFIFNDNKNGESIHGDFKINIQPFSSMIFSESNEEIDIHRNFILSNNYVPKDYFGGLHYTEYIINDLIYSNRKDLFDCYDKCFDDMEFIVNQTNKVIEKEKVKCKEK